MPTPDQTSTPNSQSHGEQTTYTQAEVAKELEALGIDYQRDILGLHLPAPTDPDADINAAVAAAKAEREAAKPEDLKKIEQLNHTEQYRDQVNMLRQAGVVETLPSGAEGIIGIDGQEYPLPTLEQVEKKLAASAELVETKAEQGFTQMLLVPFGMPLDELIRKYSQALKTKASSPAGLKSSDGTQLELNRDWPILVSSYWRDTDKFGQMVYYPEQFTPDGHHGQTKSELITADGQAWQIMLVEEMADIPSAEVGEEMGGRQQLEPGDTPDNYLNTLRAGPSYANESGLTPETWLTLALTRLDESGEVLDDYQGNGKADYLLGACNPSTGALPYGYWGRDYRKAYLGHADPGIAFGDYGCRSAVRIF